MSAAPASWRARLARHLLSSANLAGCAAALLVVGLFLADVIGAGWAWMALGAYAAGALPFLFSAPPPPLPEGRPTAQVLDALERDVQPRLPAEAAPLLAGLVARLRELMPRLKELESEGRVDAAARAQFRNLVVRLLPETLEAYLKLPADYARSARLPDGLTPQEHLLAQLDALQRHVQALEDALMSPYVNQLLVNTRFLQDKVAQSPDLSGRDAA